MLVSNLSPPNDDTAQTWTVKSTVIPSPRGPNLLLLKWNGYFNIEPISLAPPLDCPPLLLSLGWIYNHRIIYDCFVTDRSAAMPPVVVGHSREETNNNNNISMHDDDLWSIDTGVHIKQTESLFKTTKDKQKECTGEDEDPPGMDDMVLIYYFYVSSCDLKRPEPKPTPYIYFKRIIICNFIIAFFVHLPLYEQTNHRRRGVLRNLNSTLSRAKTDLNFSRLLWWSIWIS